MDKYHLDSYDGLTEILHVDPVTGEFSIETKADVQDVLDRNAARRNGRFGANPRSELRLLAEVDLVTVMNWRKEGIDVFDRNHDRALRRKIDENPYFKAVANRVNPSIIIKGKR